MEGLKIATSSNSVASVEIPRQIVRIEQTDFTDVVAAADVNAGILAQLKATGFDLPTVIAVEGDEYFSPHYLPNINPLPGFSPELQGVYIKKKDHG